MDRLETELIKVLAIDPYPVVAKGIVSFLLTEQKLFVVDTAFNSYEALKLTRDWKPNIIILDVNLPDTNWTQLATKLRQELVHVKIIAFSDQILDDKKDLKYKM
jgi:Response regulator containing a CheY-like receiver domain and an HTH DNA-binding domain